MDLYPSFTFCFMVPSLPSLPPGLAFHPGKFVHRTKPATKKKPKYPPGHVHIKKRYTPSVSILKPKASFEIDNTHMLYTASRCPVMYRTWLQFMGQSITDRYIYFDTLRLAKADKLNTSFLKHPEMEKHTRRLLFWAKKEQNVRTQMRKVVALWLQKRYESRMLNTEDPATMAEPDKPVLIFDSKARGSYVFEASTIKRQMEENLGYCKWLISEPQAPKNPMTNLPFHMGQVTEIFRQLSIYGLSSWILEGYKEHHYNLTEFLEFFRQPLRMRTVETCRKSPTSEDTLDFVTEFIEDEFDYHDIPYTSTLTILKWGLEHKSDLKYMRKWVDVWSEYYKAIIVHGEQTVRDSPQLVDFVHDMSYDLFQNKTMIQKLGRMRLEQRIKEPSTSTTSIYSLEADELEQERPTVRVRLDVGVDLGDGVSNVHVALDTISDALIEALLHHAPPSD